MKRFAIICVMALSIVLMAHAHSGGTDANGGHYNRKTGEYHYHHGYPEHQHYNGVCPYDYKDNTRKRSAVPNATTPPDDTGKDEDGIPVGVLAGGGAGAALMYAIGKAKGNK